MYTLVKKLVAYTTERYVHSAHFTTEKNKFGGGGAVEER